MKFNAYIFTITIKYMDSLSNSKITRPTSTKEITITACFYLTALFNAIKLLLKEKQYNIYSISIDKKPPLLSLRKHKKQTLKTKMSLKDHEKLRNTFKPDYSIKKYFEKPIELLEKRKITKEKE